MLMDSFSISMERGRGRYLRMTNGLQGLLPTYEIAYICNCLGIVDRIE